MAEIKLDALYPYPIEAVWDALIDPQALSEWIMPVEGFKPVRGQKFVFRDKPVMNWAGAFYCEILDAQPPHTLVWSQREVEDSSDFQTVTWTLRAEGGGTRVRLRHEGLTGLHGAVMKVVMSSGWKTMLTKRLPPVLAARAKSL